MKTLITSLCILLSLQTSFAQKKQKAPPEKGMIKINAQVDYSSSSRFDTNKCDVGTDGTAFCIKSKEQTDIASHLSLSGEWEYHTDSTNGSFSVYYSYDPENPANNVTANGNSSGNGELKASGGYDEHSPTSYEYWVGDKLLNGSHKNKVTTCNSPNTVDVEIRIVPPNTKGDFSSFKIIAGFKGKEEVSGEEYLLKSLIKSLSISKDGRGFEGEFDKPAWYPMDTTSEAEGGVSAEDNDEPGNTTMKVTATPIGYILTGKYSEKTFDHGERNEMTSYSITIGKPEYEVELVPIDEKGYKEKWLPEGPDMNENGAVYAGVPKRDIKKGNAIAFHIEVRDKKTHQLVTPECEAKFKLAQVTKIPGWCGNFPSEKPDQGNDMKFYVPLADAIKFSSANDLVIETTKEYGYTDVWVVSYDYGGYGEISATVKIDGKEYPAKCKIDKEDFITIPYCKDDSKIAWAWKEKNKCQDLKDESDDDDKEKVKKGMGDHEGDGFTVFEEYRGFCENRNHIRTDPMKKDVMIYDEYKLHAAANLKDRAADGITIFKTATQTDVHYKFKEDEFGKKADVAAEGTPRDKILNFNNDPGLHSVDQHGLWIHFNPAKLGYAFAALKNPGGGIGTPKRYKYLDITADFDPSAKGYATTQGTVNSNKSVSGGGGKAKIITDEFAVTVAHEMLHCCNVKHHGDGKDFGRWSFASGKVIPGYDVTKIYGAKNSDTNNTGQLIVLPVNLYDEADPPALINANDPRFQKMWQEYTVGGEHGTCSGVEDCIMRYDDASAVKKPNGNIYILPNRYGQSELTGMYLCDKADGSGVNESGRKPFSRYGNADAGRGNCKKQFCVNDKYH